MNRIALAGCALALVLVSAGNTGCRHAETPQPSYDVPVVRVELKHGANTEAANLHTEAALQKHVTLSMDNLTLDQAVEFTRDTTGANIAVNWPALELVGIDRDSLVSVRLADVPAIKFLRVCWIRSAPMRSTETNRGPWFTTACY